jgi:hypothetical protein
MIGDTGTNYFRKTSAWRGSLLLTVARGGWVIRARQRVRLSMRWRS